MISGTGWAATSQKLFLQFIKIQTETMLPQSQEIYRSQGQSRLTLDAARLYMSPPISESIQYVSQNNDVFAANVGSVMQLTGFQGNDPRVYASFNSAGVGYRPMQASEAQRSFLPNDSRLYSSTKNDRESGQLLQGMAPHQFRTAAEQSRRTRPFTQAMDVNIYASQNSEGRSSQRSFPDKQPDAGQNQRVRERKMYASQNSDGAASERSLSAQGRRRNPPAMGADSRLYSSQSSEGSVKLASMQAAQFVQVRDCGERMGEATDTDTERL